MEIRKIGRDKSVADILELSQNSDLVLVTNEQTKKVVGVVTPASILSTIDSLNPYRANDIDVETAMHSTDDTFFVSENDSKSISMLTKKVLANDIVLVKDNRGKVKKGFSIKDVLKKMDESTSLFITIERIEKALREILINDIKCYKKENFEYSKNGESPSFGNYIDAFKRYWNACPPRITEVFGKYDLVGYLENAQKVRNSVMHFLKNDFDNEMIKKLHEFDVKLNNNKYL